jgi:hypothetical protein
MVMTPWDELRTLDRKSKRPVLNILSAAVTFQVKSSTVDVTVSDIPVNAVTRGINNIIDLMSLIVIEDLAGNAWLDSDTDTLIFGKNKYPKISTPRGFKRFIKSLDGRQFLT